jgi:heme-degrading monooxygenase HmoA
MWVRQTTIVVQPDKIDELKKIYNEEVMPLAKARPGNLAMYLLEPADGENEFISYTLWDTRENADAYASSGTYKALVDKVRHCVVGDPALREYQVEDTGNTAAS